MLDDLDELDRRVFGESGLRVIYRWVIPIFLLAFGVAKLLLDVLGDRGRSPLAGLFFVGFGLALLITGLRPPARRTDHAHSEHAERPGSEPRDIVA
jgi:hypothetical protein